MLSTAIVTIILLALLLLQVILALVHSRVNFNLQRKRDFRPASRITVVDLLQKFSRIHLEVDMRVDAAIQRPAKYKHGLLHVNKAHVYSDQALDLLHSLAELVKYKHDWDWEFFGVWQKFGFLLQLAALPLAWGQPVALAALLGLSILQIILSIHLASREQNVIRHTLNLAWDLLDLSEVEQEKVEKLLEYLPAAAYVYPLELVHDALGFVVGYRHKSKP